MRALMPIVVMLLIVGCGGRNDNPGILGGHHAKVRILVKKVGGVCKTLTFPKRHAVLNGDEEELVWDIKVKDGCLDAVDLVVKWKDAGKNPSECAQVATNTHGNKRQIKCNLKSPVADGIYEYSVTVDTQVEDPDVEIVTF